MSEKIEEKDKQIQELLERIPSEIILRVFIKSYLESKSWTKKIEILFLTGQYRHVNQDIFDFDCEKCIYRDECNDNQKWRAERLGYCLGYTLDEKEV